ncbi:MAG: M91 family zinc metallopeptidase [Archangium sp.]
MGGDGDDVIVGGAGNDTMTGGLGNNTLVGGAGKNTFANAGGTDRDFHNDGDRFGNLKGAKGTKAPTKIEAGDVSAANAPGHTIEIQGSDEFKAKVQAELEVIRSTPSGRAMLADIDKQNAAGKPIRIKEGSEDVHADGLNTATPDVETDALPKGMKSKKGEGTGKGTGSIVAFSPDVHRTDDRMDQSTQPTDAADARTIDPSIALFHELVHAHRNQLAESEGLTKGEEFAAAGTRGHDSADKKAEWKYNENQYRKELGSPERYSYDA